MSAPLATKPSYGPGHTGCVGNSHTVRIAKPVQIGLQVVQKRILAAEQVPATADIQPQPGAHAGCVTFRCDPGCETSTAFGQRVEGPTLSDRIDFAAFQSGDQGTGIRQSQARTQVHRRRRFVDRYDGPTTTLRTDRHQRIIR